MINGNPYAVILQKMRREHRQRERELVQEAIRAGFPNPDVPKFKTLVELSEHDRLQLIGCLAAFGQDGNLYIHSKAIIERMDYHDMYAWRVVHFSQGRAHIAQIDTQAYAEEGNVMVL